MQNESQVLQAVSNRVTTSDSVKSYSHELSAGTTRIIAQMNEKGKRKINISSTYWDKFCTGMSIYCAERNWRG